MRIVRGLEASTSDHAMSRATVNSIQTCASTAEHAGHGMLLISYHPYEGVLLFVNCELSFSAEFSLRYCLSFHEDTQLMIFIRRTSLRLSRCGGIPLTASGSSKPLMLAVRTQITLSLIFRPAHCYHSGVTYCFTGINKAPFLLVCVQASLEFFCARSIERHD